MSDCLNNIIGYIEKNLNQDLTLDVISREFSYSKYHLSRLFNRVVGCSINEYVNKRRLSIVAKELIYTTKSVEYISHTNNYKSSKYLSTLFKQQFGITPSNYRRNNIFINLQYKRKIIGGSKMRAIKYDKLIPYLIMKTKNRDEVLDYLSTIETCNVLVFDRSNLEIIFVDNSEEFDILYHSKIDLVAGTHVKSNLFSTKNMPNVIIKSIIEENNEYTLELFDNSTNETAKVKTEQYMKRKTEYFVRGLDNEVDFGKQSTIVNYDYDVLHIDRFVSAILKTRNHDEVTSLVNSKQLALFKFFNSEYIFFAVSYSISGYRITGIYFDLENKEYELVPIFSADRGNKSPIIEVIDGECFIVIDDIKYLRLSILIYPKDFARIKIRLANGYVGNGAWYKKDVFTT